MFIGQDRIRRELYYLLREIKNGENYNILFRAPSGHGKTRLATILLNEIGEKYNYYLPNKRYVSIDEKVRCHFIDEIHILKVPEILYPIMDKRDHLIVLASNESGDLKEPLINRCIPFIFDPYTDGEIAQIITNDMRKWNFNSELIWELVRVVKRNPRNAKVLVARLNYILNNVPMPKSVQQLRDLLLSVMNIENGMTAFERRYLSYLEVAGGQSSLNRIIYGTRLDENTIIREIEPALIQMGRIRITSRGRELLDGE
jgi:Holliday junction resolvasome RuvABC ATP-dependent DNA helicase subunit